ncbi:MAG: shikimate kinase [Chthoniobacterales bacterium]
MRDRNATLVLTGFMGAGKSSIGRLLAEQTGLPLRDTDELVRAESGREVAEFIARQGEEEFRALEAALVQKLENAPGIIATGGGVVLNPESVRKLRGLGTVVYLAAAPDALWERLRGGTGRPLLAKPDPRTTFTELLKMREPLYRRLADVTVDTSTLTLEEAAAAVLRTWKPADGTQS